MTPELLIVFLIFTFLTLVFLRFLPPTSALWRFMTREWRVKPVGGFGQPSRGDYLRYALYVELGAVLLVTATIGFAVASDAVRPFSTTQSVLSGLVFGSFLLSGLAVTGGVVLVVEAIRWRPRPPLPFVVYSGDDVIGQTALGDQLLPAGLVRGGLRPEPAFGGTVGAVRELSDSILDSDDIGTRKRLISDFSIYHDVRVATVDGVEVPAHNVSITDLARLKLGRGFWVEVTLTDINHWRALVGR